MTAVKSGASYRNIEMGLVRSLVRQELLKDRSSKAVVQAVRNKLHRIGGAYRQPGLDYRRWKAEMIGLDRSLTSPAHQEFCRRVMGSHVSTRERLPILEEFYRQTLATIGPITPCSIWHVV